MNTTNYKPDSPAFLRLLQRSVADAPELRATVEKIIDDVRKRGDAALLHFTEKFDHIKLTPSQLKISAKEISVAAEKVTTEFLTAISLARVNIRRFHEYQRRASYHHEDGDGVLLSKKVLPLSCVGIYIPSGSAPLFSSLLMGAIPAFIAGVEKIIVCAAPNKNGEIDPHILTTAKMLDLNEIYCVGGAQAIAAMAYGTKTIPRVDKIVGPGNQYVNMAKRLVFGQCGIESLAGPSELVIVADKTAPARFVAADLLSQLEHGSGVEAAILFTDSKDLAAGVKIELNKQIKTLSREEKITTALKNYGAIFYVENLLHAIDAVNILAPEHLQIIANHQEELLSEVKNAGAIFIGAYSAETVGDYFAGTNHVLPTAGSARFMSSLSVYDFVKDISIIRYTPERLRRTGRHIIEMANTEGLTAHANAITVRLERQR